MKVFILLFLFLSFSATATVNDPDTPDLHSIVSLAQGLDAVVESSGQVDCDHDEAWVSLRNQQTLPGQVNDRDLPMIRGLLRTCLNNRRIRDNVWRDVYQPWRILCTAPNGYKNHRRHYQIGRQNGRIRVRIPINFVLAPGERDAAGARRKLERAKSCASRFYARYGLSVEIENENSPSVPRVLYSGEVGRSNTSSIHLGEDATHNSCTMMVHEMGHYMGLQDRYARMDECPARPGIMPADDVMNNGGVYPPEMLMLNAIDFSTIIQPLCRP